MADFRFFINRQGPRGPQGLKGEKGDPGNTFTVSEGVNTPTEYTLIFDGGDGNQFETDNLRNPIVDRGGTYVRYDRDNVTQYIGEPDMAVIDETPGIVNLAGKDTVTPNASDAVAYELLEKTVDELNTALEGLDDRLDTDEGDISQAKSDIVGLDNRVTTNEGNITSLQSGKADKSTTYTKTEVNSALAGKANTVHTHTVSQITNAGALASQNTVDYQTQVTNKPTIPTVGNGTITLTQGGVAKGTFTTNQSGNSTIDLDAGGGSTLTAGSGINIANDTISVKVDGTTISTNNDGELTAIVSSGDTVAAGDGIVISPNIAIPGEKIIGVYYDGVTINKNGDGQLVAMIPDVSHMVTDNTTQSITGTKTYGAGNLKINDLCLSDGSKIIEDKGTYVYVGSPGVTTKIKSNNTKLYFNGQSGVDEEIAKVSQLPGAATSSTLGLVQPDNTTIAVDANGVISANIPTPETVDQTYDASSTHAQSGVAIAGAGFMNGSIVQSPLQYLPDTTGNLTYQNVNTGTMVGSGYGVVVASGLTSATSPYGVRVYTSNTYTDLLTSSDKTSLINNSSLTWFETTLVNGINFTCKTRNRGTQENNYTYILGHYENSTFIPDAAASADNFYGIMSIISTGNKYATDVSYGTAACSFYLSGTSLIVAAEDGVSDFQDKQTRIITSSEADILNAVTHIRVYRSSNSSTNLTLSDVKVINPTSATPVTDGNGATRYNLFTNGTNIFDAHPESLSLKYDSTTLGVNANNELYALSSTPTNMVTTDTNQTITGVKNITSLDIKGSSYTGGSFRLSSTGSIKYLGNGTSEGESYLSISPYSLSVIRGVTGNVGLWSYGSNNTGIAYRNGSYYGKIQYYNGKYVISSSNTSDTKIYKVTGDITSPTINTSTNFLLEKDMLDGTTIQYNSTSGKVEVLESQQEGVLPVSDDVTEIFTTNYTIIGSPTITSDHVFSTTSGSDTLTSTVPFKPASQAVAHSLKFECQFRPTASSHANGEGIFCRDSSSDGVRISLNSSACVRFRTSINGSGALDVTFSNTPLVQNTLYKLTAEIAAGASSGTGTLYTSSDNGTTWTTAETVTLGTNTPLAIGSGSSSLHYFGVNTPGPTLPFGGEILLDKMYLEEDGVIIWTPVAVTGNITEIGKATTSEYGLVKNPLTLPNYADTTNTVDYSSMGTTAQTMPSDGWFVCASNPSSNGTRELLINGVAVNGGNRMTGVVPDVGGCYPVKKGDIVQFSGVSNATNTYWLAKLIPFRSI